MWSRLFFGLTFLNICFIFAAIEKTLSHKLEDARSTMQLRIVKALREYRNLYAVQHRLANRMIYPESLKFLPLYGLALCKSTPLRGGYTDAPLDERCAAGHTMMTLSVTRLLKFLYPSLIRLDECLLKVYFYCPRNLVSLTVPRTNSDCFVFSHLHALVT